MHNPHDLPIPPINPDHTLEQTQAHWEKELGYTCEAERTLIRNMAAARVELDRCHAANSANQALNLQKAQKKQLQIRRKRIRKLAQSLHESPSDTLTALESTQEGRDWLAGRWRALDQALAQGLNLTEQLCKQGMNLMGYLGRPPGPDAPMFARQLWANLFQAGLSNFRFDIAAGVLPPATAKVCLGGFIPPPQVPADEFQARDWLRDLCGNERVRLDQLRRDAESDLAADPEAQAQVTLETQALAANAKLAATDRATLARARLQKEADLSYARNLSLLMRLRNGRRAERDWELKESRRRPVDTTPVKNAHRPTSIVANPEEIETSAPESTSAPQRTNSAPDRPESAPPTPGTPARDPNPALSTSDTVARSEATEPGEGPSPPNQPDRVRSTHPPAAFQ